MKRTIFILACATAAFLLLLFILTTQFTTSQNLVNAAPVVSPIATTTPVFSATMEISPSHNQVVVGDTLIVTVSISVSQGCEYPIYELTLQQTSGDGGEFAYVSPPTHTVGPPVTNPFVYTLTAVNTGTVSFNGLAYGERYCGDYWNWTYVNGVSAIIYIGMEPYLVYLPMIGGE